MASLGVPAVVGSPTGPAAGFSAGDACLCSGGAWGCLDGPWRRVLQASVTPPVDLAQPARDWQARRIGQIAFGAALLFLAQLYLAPAQWFPQTEPLRLALVLSCIALAALAAQRLIANRPLWLGFRTALLAVYTGAALLSPTWSIAPALSVDGALEVAKHFLFFVAVLNTFTTPRRIRLAMLVYAAASIVPGWGTFSNWWHDELLVGGFRGRWLGVMADPNHDCMALVAAVPFLLHFAAHGPGLWRRIVGAGGVTAVLMGIVATHSRGGSLGLAAAVLLFATGWVLDRFARFDKKDHNRIYKLNNTSIYPIEPVNPV